MGVGTATCLIFALNSIIDLNEHQDITFDDIRNAIKSGNLVSWLSHKFPTEDFTFLDDCTSKRITAIISEISISVHPSKKFGISNNGICWLIAMLVELVQNWKDWNEAV